MTTLGRRQFLAGAGALAAALPSVRLTTSAEASVVKKADATFQGAVRLKPDATFPPSVRADFPSVLRETYMNSASMHPVGTFAADAV